MSKKQCTITLLDDDEMSATVRFNTEQVTVEDVTRVMLAAYQHLRDSIGEADQFIQLMDEVMIPTAAAVVQRRTEVENTRAAVVEGTDPVDAVDATLQQFSNIVAGKGREDN